ncbi:sugar-phosphatase [Levilactobacillus parabrevis]|uniref:sugar-phosphatase n=1 Tax=Levilactobacillus parabrevis TaxID=357278 RepID=UPI0037565CC2
MTPKLIAVDIDGTLLDPQNTLTAATITAIQAAVATGIKVVLCTGRPLTGVQPYLDALGLHGDDQYVITYNGGLVQTTTGTVLASNALSYADYVDLEAFARKSRVHFHVVTPKHLYTADRDISRYTVKESQLVHLPLRFREATAMDPQLLMPTAVYIDEVAKIDALRLPAAFHQRFYVVRTDPHFIEVMAPQTNKGNALQKLATYLNLPIAAVMALGDQDNDLPMITTAGLGVAMGNANDRVKAAADVTTLTNADDGVAAAIYKYALNPDLA